MIFPLKISAGKVLQEFHLRTYVCDLVNIIKTHDQLTVVSRAAKQSRTGDTTVCYIHERSILIERSPKADCKNQPYEKTTRDTKLLNPLTIIRHVRLILNNYSLPFFSNTLWNVGQSVVFFFSFSSFAYSLRMWALVPKIFEAYISACVLARAMKLLYKLSNDIIYYPA